MKKYTKDKYGYYNTTTKKINKDGTIGRKKIADKNFDDFIEKLRIAKKEFSNGNDIGSDTRFGELANIYFNIYMKNAKKAYSYERTYEKHIKASFYDLKVSIIKPINVKQLINDLIAKEIKRSTIDEVILIARQILNIAIEHEVLIRNVFSKVKYDLPEELEAEIREPITKKQQSLLERHWKGHRMGFPAALMLIMGLRRGEMLALNKSDFNFEQGTLQIERQIVFDKHDKPHIAPPKTKAGKRLLVIPTSFLPAVKDALERLPHPTLIYPAMKSKTYMTKSAYDSAWESFMNYLNLRAGGSNATRSKPRVRVIDEFTAHQLRHTCATMLFEADVDPKTAQKFLGHANLQITLEIYTHLREEKENSSMNGYSQLLAEKAICAKTHFKPLDMYEIDSTQAIAQESNVVLFPRVAKHMVVSSE